MLQSLCCASHQLYICVFIYDNRKWKSTRKPDSPPVYNTKPNQQQ